MSKFGWSYPPGCSGPPEEDTKSEAMAEAIYEALEPLRAKIDMGYEECEKVHEQIELNLMKIVGDAYDEGYADGCRHEIEGMANERNRR